jgi:uncharacterized membrane protein YhaH (DUF805 family)
MDPIQPAPSQPLPNADLTSSTPSSATPAPPITPVTPSHTQQGVFTGRIGRLGYLLGVLYIAAAYVVIVLLYALVIFGATQSGKSPSGSPLLAVVNVVAFLFGAALVLVGIPVGIGMQIRRWHDMGHSGWLVLLAFVPFANLVLFVFMFFVPGSAGPNQYGETYSGSLSPLRVYGLKGQS